ncbi:MAG: glycosyltransferase [Lachnospiraceae bacterium]|nr:glycosyltransferase [Lachnospiraceae bacterium]
MATKRFLINGTYKNLEIILIDDVSTDGSEHICNKYQIKDKRISVIHQKDNIGDWLHILHHL